MNQDLLNCAAFAAIMTLRSALKEGQDEKAKLAAQNAYDHSVPIEQPRTFDYDRSNGVTRLEEAAQTLFDQADAACGTNLAVDAKLMVPMQICGLLLQAIDRFNVDTFTKRAVYDRAIEYCLLDDVATGEMLFPTANNELADTIGIQLVDQTIDSILSAAEGSGNQTGGLGYFAMLSEFLIYVEEAIKASFPDVSITVRPSLLALETTLNKTQTKMAKMLEADPGLAAEPNGEENDSIKEKTATLLKTARRALSAKNIQRAKQLYLELLQLNPSHWEAQFFVAACDALYGASVGRLTHLSVYTNNLKDAALKTLPLAKQQLFTRRDILDGVGCVVTSVSNFVTDFFVATMNDYRAAPGRLTSGTKNLRVNSLINTVFVIGDCIESLFDNDPEICGATAGNLWQIGFTMYESCDMAPPENAELHYGKARQYDPSFYCKKPMNARSTGSSDGCYIATAVYGSYDCPPVWTLRRFRDESLSLTAPGRLLIRLYYRISPTLVKLFSDRRWFRHIWRNRLDRLVGKLRAKGYSDKPYMDIDWQNR